MNKLIINCIPVQMYPGWHVVMVLYLKINTSEFLPLSSWQKHISPLSSTWQERNTFLPGRMLTIVVVNGIHTKPTDVLSGVPQGSVIGPLLFLILIGNIDKSVFFSSFADETWIGKGIVSKEDGIELQKDLNAVYQWATDNNMVFNCDKFECVQYGRDKELQNTISYHSNTGSIIAERKQCEQRFKTFNFKNVANKCVAGYPELSGQEKSVTWSSRGNHYCQNWTTAVSSSLHQRRGIFTLEVIQRSSTKKMAGINTTGNWNYFLQRRQERYRIIYTWQILEGQVPNIGENSIVIKSHT